MKTTILILLFTFTGCANNGPLVAFTPKKEIVIGMSKKEVKELKGEPYRRAAQGGYEYMVFIEGTGFLSPPHQYYYRFNNGKLDEFGSLNDFKSETVNVRFQ